MKHFGRLLFITNLVASLSCLCSVSRAVAGDDYVEKGRFGVIVSQTSDGTQAGALYVSDSFETALTVDGSFVDRKSSSAGVTQTGDMGLT